MGRPAGWAPARAQWPMTQLLCPMALSYVLCPVLCPTALSYVLRPCPMSYGPVPTGYVGAWMWFKFGGRMSYGPAPDFCS